MVVFWILCITVLLHILSYNDCSVRWPFEDKIKQYNLYLNLLQACCMYDRLKLHFERAGSSHNQNMFYNGWTYTHSVTNIYVFSHNGIVIAAIVNAPGSMHNLTITELGSIYNILYSKIIIEIIANVSWIQHL